ncbi:MAG: hypothetical protein HPZ91_14875 [Lentisphaeria bacterium]|nr:hypothetical protein [Lentisphaeria bacterium]
MFFIGGPGNAFCRKVLVLDKPVAAAFATVIADPHSYAYPSWMEQPGMEHNWLLAGSFIKYRFYVNGRMAGIGPVRPIRTERAVETHFTLTGTLHKGVNVLGVISRGERFGFAMVIRVDFTDGSFGEFVTGADWRVLPANEIYSPFCWRKPALSFLKGSFGPGEQPEHIDGERFPYGWLSPDFDDSGWEPAVCQADDKAYELEPSLVPAYEETRVAPAKIDYLPDGRIVIDFGRHIVGFLELASRKAGLVEIRLGEELLPYGGVRFQMRTGNCYQEGWSFPQGGARLFHFGIRSFRYAELVGYPGRLIARSIAAIALNSPFEEGDSSFECSDPRLEQVWQLCRNSVKYTTLDVYYDCPSRERMAYEADAYINMLTHFSVESRTRVAKRTILYQMNHYTWPCEWRLFMAPVVYEYFMHTGDLELVRQVYGRLVSECSFHSLLRDGLVPEFPMRVIVDWPPSCRDEYEFGPDNAVPNAFQYWALDRLSKLAGYLGKKKDSAGFAALAASVKQAFNTRLYDPEQGLFVDNSASRHAGFHTNMFALAFGVADTDKTAKAAEFIDRAGMRCSVYGAQFYLDALFECRRADRAVELMTADSDRSWLHMIELGATTATEAWNPELKPNMSFVHPWGSAPGNIVSRRLFGLRPTAPGWKEFSFDPQPGPLQFGSLRLKTPAGVIAAGFDRRDGELKSGCSLLREDDPWKNKN